MSEFIQTLDKSERRDDPRFWAESDVIAQPDFDLSAFQKRINSIVGLTPDKKEIVRVRWAWNMDCFSMFFTDWDIDGKPIAHELRAKYLFRTIETPDGKIDIPPPRFVMEERLEPAQYYDSWEENRWQYDTTAKRKVPVRPMPPRDGYYSFLYYIAAHDPGQTCCERAAKASSECFGLYREPSDKDLNILRKVRRQIEQNKDQINPYKPLDSDALNKIFTETESRARGEEEKKLIRDEETVKEFEDIMTPLAAWSMPKAARLPNEKKTASGLIIPGNLK